MPEVNGKYLVQAGWDDVPHLDAETKRQLLNATPPYAREARSKGIPSLGAGVIYPVPESDYVIDPIKLPPHYPRGYALDVGWNRTAALWGAYDRSYATLYLYAEHYRGQAEPSVHASAIRARGEWIPGIIDPAARGRSQLDGEQILANYIGQGLNVQPGDNAVESGLYRVWERLSGGRIKVFRTLQNFLAEIRIYRRDDKGNIVKKNDHLMDCLRMMANSGYAYFKQEPVNVGRESLGGGGSDELGIY